MGGRPPSGLGAAHRFMQVASFPKRFIGRVVVGLRGRSISPPLHQRWIRTKAPQSADISAACLLAAVVPSPLRLKLKKARDLRILNRPRSRSRAAPVMHAQTETPAFARVCLAGLYAGFCR